MSGVLSSASSTTRTNIFRTKALRSDDLLAGLLEAAVKAFLWKLRHDSKLPREGPGCRGTCARIRRKRRWPRTAAHLPERLDPSIVLQTCPITSCISGRSLTVRPAILNGWQPFRRSRLSVAAKFRDKHAENALRGRVLSASAEPRSGECCVLLASLRMRWIGLAWDSLDNARRPWSRDHSSDSKSGSTQQCTIFIERSFPASKAHQHL
jgi:hypothetical protein